MIPLLTYPQLIDRSVEEQYRGLVQRWVAESRIVCAYIPKVEHRRRLGGHRRGLRARVRARNHRRRTEAPMNCPHGYGTELIKCPLGFPGCMCADALGAWETIWDEKDDPDHRSVALDRLPKTRVVNLAGGHGFHGERPTVARRSGKGKTGRVLDGRTWDEFPGGAS